MSGQGGILSSLARAGRWLEDALLVLILTGMILLAAAQIVLRNFFDVGFIWGDELLRMLVLWLAVAGAVASVIGAYYYLRVIWYMYFEQGEDQAVLQAGNDTRLVLTLNSLAVLALGIVPGWLWALCTAVFAPL